MGNGTSNSIPKSDAWRETGVVMQNRVHKDTCNRLNGAGHSCPKNPFPAIQKAYRLGVIDRSTAAEYKGWNRVGNAAKHSWE